MEKKAVARVEIVFFSCYGMPEKKRMKEKTKEGRTMAKAGSAQLSDKDRKFREFDYVCVRSAGVFPVCESFF